MAIFCRALERIEMKKGFTLAETLITLAVIGIVAAITIPVVVAKYDEKARITSLKKAYSALSQAYQLAVAENGPISDWGASITDTGKTDENNNPVLDNSGREEVAKIISKYLNVLKWCEIGQVCDERELFSADNKSIMYSSAYGIMTAKHTFFLTDGTKISTGYIVNSAEGAYADIFVVLPGNRKNNRIGYDAFYFYLKPDGRVLPSGLPGDWANIYTEGAGHGRTAWVLQYENFDYLKCDDLEWGKKTSCRG